MTTATQDAISDDELMARATWYPTDESRRKTNWAAFIAYTGLPDYPALEQKASEDPAWFWDAIIRFFDIRFQTPYHTLLERTGDVARPRWCIGGRMNMTETLLDRHLQAGRGTHPALLWEGEDGSQRALSYAEAAAAVSNLARGLVADGLKPGDVVGLFMPMVPETAIAFMAIVRAGGVVLPLFSGFGANAIASRLQDAEATMVIAAEATMRRGKVSPMKAALDEALHDVTSVHRVIVFPMTRTADMLAGRDLWWDEIAKPGPEFPAVIVGADDPMMVIYTSGTTGKPKGTVHTHCGFTAKTALDYFLCFDIKPEDRWIWMSDIGWLIGPLQIVATFITGATLAMAEGGPDYPDNGRLWRLVQDHRLTLLGLSPTIARLMKSYGAEEAAKHDLSSLRGVVSTGEPWDLSSWAWLYEDVLGKRIPIMNNIGGTELGAILVTNLLYPIKPKSFHGSAPGTGADIVDDEGRSVGNGEVGELVVRAPSIGTTRGLWNGDPRFADYWSRFPGIWTHGDFASRDADGDWFIHGRSDDTIKIAGKRTGPAEIEALLLATGLVKDAAAVGVPDEIKGSAIVCAVVPRPGQAVDATLETAMSRAITAGLGAPFKPRRLIFVSDLPRTRNLKVMRRVIRAILTGGSPGDLTALVNPESVEELRAKL